MIEALASLASCHSPTKENKQTNVVFLHVSGPWKNWLEMTPNEAGMFFPTNPPLVTFWAERILGPIILIFLFDLFGFPDFWISIFLDSQFQGCQLWP